MAPDLDSPEDPSPEKIVPIETLLPPLNNLCPVHLTFSTYEYCSRKLLDGSKYCFFHTPGVAKYQPEVIRSHFGEDITLADILTREIATGRSLEQAYLANARLGGGIFKRGSNLKNGVLVRADLSGAHLSYSTLDNVNFALANLEGVYLSDCSLSGVRFTFARLFKAKFRNNEFNNIIGLKKENFKGLKWGWLPIHKMLEEYPQQCEEMYRRLALYFSSQGLLDDASWASYRACIMRHRQLTAGLSKAKQFADELMEYMVFPAQATNWEKLKSFARKIIAFGEWMRSLVFWLLMGYGEKPFRVLINAASVILLYAIAYHQAGAINDNTFVGALYFSAITFTTVGYGDVAPHGPFRLFAASEGLFGIFLCGLFLFCLGRRSVGRS